MLRNPCLCFKENVVIWVDGSQNQALERALAKQLKKGLCFLDAVTEGRAEFRTRCCLWNWSLTDW